MLEDRRAAYADLMERIRKDPPFLVLYQPYESWGLRKSVNWAPKPGHIPYVLDFRAGSIDANVLQGNEHVLLVCKKNKSVLRTTHAYLGSAALCLLFLHALLGLKLGLAI